VRFKVRKKVFYFIICFFASLSFQAYAQTQLDLKLFQEAKIFIFDKKWTKAQDKLEELLEKYPHSRLFSQALFYKAKCLAEQEGKEVEALKAYQSYLEFKDRSESLAEEAEISIIELAFELYEKRKKSYLKEVEKRLASSNKVVKYFAAFKLSYVKDKRIAAKGIPILKEIIRKERDNELKDRARIALLRADPDALKDIEDERFERRAKILKIRFYVEGKKKPEFSLDIPWALADLALSAIPEKEKAELRKEGYDLDKIIEELTRARGNILEIRTEGKIYKIWVE